MADNGSALSGRRWRVRMDTTRSCRARSNDGMDSSRDLNGIVCQSRLAFKSPLEGGAR
jgi:hypothetical protein